MNISYTLSASCAWLLLYLAREGFATFGTGPKIYPVVQLWKLSFTVQISPRMKGTLMGYAKSWLKLSHYRHPGLKFIHFKHPIHSIVLITWCISRRAIADNSLLHFLNGFIDVGGRGSCGINTRRTTPATARTFHNVKLARQTSLIDPILLARTKSLLQITVNWKVSPRSCSTS